MMQNLKVDIKNLGPIKHGTFEGKPLTLFCGPNNSGKTWAMYVLYHVYRAPYWIVDAPEVVKVYSQLAAQGTATISIREWLNAAGPEIAEWMSGFIVNFLPDTFNAEDVLFEQTELVLAINLETFIEQMIARAIDVSYAPRGNTITLHKPAGAEQLHISFKADGERSTNPMKHLLPLVFDAVERKVFLMPAERNGLHLFYRELSSKRTALLHHASRKTIDLHELLRDVMQSHYAKPIADYIDWLNDLTEIQKSKRSGDFHSIAQAIKKGLASGNYTVSARSGEISFKPYQKARDGDATQKMGLHLTSSTVKSLFGLWFYLEHQAQKGDVLMIDEPELNIHPENQRKLARIVARLVNGGLNVVLSTHSDYFVRELNSLIMLDQEDAKGKLRKKHGYAKDEVLSADKVGAYLFDDQTITPFEITKQDGIYAKTFDDVIHDLNKTNDDIYYSLAETDADE